MPRVAWVNGLGKTVTGRAVAIIGEGYSFVVEDGQSAAFGRPIENKYLTEIPEPEPESRHEAGELRLAWIANGDGYYAYLTEEYYTQVVKVETSEYNGTCVWFIGNECEQDIDKFDKEFQFLAGSVEFLFSDSPEIPQPVKTERPVGHLRRRQLLSTLAEGVKSLSGLGKTAGEILRTLHDQFAVYFPDNDRFDNIEQIGIWLNQPASYKLVLACYTTCPDDVIQFLNVNTLGYTDHEDEEDGWVDRVYMLTTQQRDVILANPATAKYGKYIDSL